MKDKILQKLKTKYSNLGLSNDVFEAVATQLATFVTEEQNIDNAVAGSEAMLKSFQSYADSRVSTFKTEADKNKTEAEALKVKLAELGNPTNPSKGEPDDVKSLLKSFSEEFKTMKDTLSQFASERQQVSLTEKLQTLVKDIPESYYKPAVFGRTFKDEDEVVKFAEVLKSGYEIHKQDLADKGFEQTKSPENGSGAGEGKEIADLINSGTKEIINSKN